MLSIEEEEDIFKNSRLPHPVRVYDSLCDPALDVRFREEYLICRCPRSTRKRSIITPIKVGKLNFIPIVDYLPLVEDETLKNGLQAYMDADMPPLIQIKDEQRKVDLAALQGYLQWTARSILNRPSVHWWELGTERKALEAVTDYYGLVTAPVAQLVVDLARCFLRLGQLEWMDELYDCRPSTRIVEWNGTVLLLAMACMGVIEIEDLSVEHTPTTLMGRTWLSEEPEPFRSLEEMAPIIKNKTLSLILLRIPLKRPPIWPLEDVFPEGVDPVKQRHNNIRRVEKRQGKRNTATGMSIASPKKIKKRKANPNPKRRFKPLSFAGKKAVKSMCIIRVHASSQLQIEAISGIVARWNPNEVLIGANCAVVSFPTPLAKEEATKALEERDYFVSDAMIS